jgi:hypothetical protein
MDVSKIEIYRIEGFRPGLGIIYTRDSQDGLRHAMGTSTLQGLGFTV